MENKELTVLDTPAATPAVLRQQVNAIQAAMKEVMELGVHYGTIPGCGDKPTLLKPGAEKIGLMFRLLTKFEVQMTDLGNGHREYQVICSLLDTTGRSIGQGVGLCSTMESKYRYRGFNSESTGREVPKAYWNNKDIELIGGKGFKPVKEDGKWMIHKAGDKKENPDIADTYNTVLKIAKKRAHVDAILTCTAASDIFTQDIEDMPIEVVKSEVVSTTDTQPKKSTLWDGSEKVGTGKNADSQWSDLNDNQLYWYRDECKNRELKANAEKELARRLKLESPDFEAINEAAIEAEIDSLNLGNN